MGGSIEPQAAVETASVLQDVDLHPASPQIVNSRQELHETGRSSRGALLSLNCILFHSCTK